MKVVHVQDSQFSAAIRLLGAFTKGSITGMEQPSRTTVNGLYKGTADIEQELWRIVSIF